MRNACIYIKKIDRQLTAEEKAWKSDINGIRIAVEWNFTKTPSIYVEKECKLKLLKSGQ
jgi:hypothetical protein